VLEVSGIDCFYGDVQVLRGMGLSAKSGEILCLLGRNGAGKTSPSMASASIPYPRTRCQNAESDTSPKGGVSSLKCQSPRTLRSAC